MMADATTDPTAAGSVLSLPNGGGAIAGLGETFVPDPCTGTGRFELPIDLPAGRLGVQPHLSLRYDTVAGNGPLGLGWELSLPGVSRKCSRGVPRQVDTGPDADVFLLSGAEDLVPVPGGDPGRVRYRPRTEGLFARVEHVHDTTGNYWDVHTKDGLRTRYGTARPDGAPADWHDPAVVADPQRPEHITAWRVTESRDPVGNLIRYEYRMDEGDEPGHTWRQPLVARVSHVDYGDPAAPSFLVEVQFDYEARPDPFSSYRSGFEIRTSKRLTTVRVVTRAADGVARTVREYRLRYEQAPFNGLSLLTSITLVGIDDQGAARIEEAMPPLVFGYGAFDPAARRLTPVAGGRLPVQPLSDPSVALVDVRGVGLPDIVQLGPVPRHWRNGGHARFELPVAMADSPPFGLDNPAVQLLDANGDGRPDLIVTGATAGYFPMAFDRGWSPRSFQAYRQAPAVDLADPRVKLIDLDGDGLTDILHSGTQLQAVFNDPDPRLAWQRAAFGSVGGNVDLADPRIRLADMTGDGLSDLVVLRSGNVAYWPNLGHGRWGAKVTMRHSPRLPDGYDPARLVLCDVDGDGVTDLVYVDSGRVLVWGNRAGGEWTPQPVVVSGTPASPTGAARPTDLTGTGMSGLLFGRAPDGSGRPDLLFLDFTGGRKPYLLTTVDNNRGATITIGYGSSTEEYLRDRTDPVNRWRTTLPFPVHVVARIESADAFSHGRLTTLFRYHHGYWDGLEREFRGFAMVEQLDSEVFDDGTLEFSPPTLTRRWFHVGPVAAAEVGDWTELDLSDGYWPGDPAMMARPATLTALLAGLSRADRRAALRALRNRPLRTELYALDGTERADRPYTVTETLSGLREESPPGPDEAGRRRVFFPFTLGERTTVWERGDEPMTTFALTADYDAFGFPTAQLAVAVPRGRDPRVADPSADQPYLATYATTEYARRDDAGHYLVDRACRTSTYEVVNDGKSAVDDLRGTVFTGQPTLRVIGHGRTFYDGAAFAGLPLGVLGEHGLPTRSESLAFTDAFLDRLYPPGDPNGVGGRPPYLNPAGPVAWTPEYPAELRELLPALAGYVHYGDAEVPGSPGGYYTTTIRRRYDVQHPVPGHPPRGLILSTQDPTGAVSVLGYDQHDLLTVSVTDPAGLVRTAAYDYRVLRQREATDANGNPASVTYSPLGLVSGHFVRGKNGEGDRDVPSIVFTYDLAAFAGRGQPVSVRTDRKVHHDTDSAADQTAKLSTVEFTDGFGRLLQTRVLAEDVLFGDPLFGGGVLPPQDGGPVGSTQGRARDAGAPDNVTVSGWQVYDNKGRTVIRYEPFFDTGFGYAEPTGARLGQRLRLFYDPRGKQIRTVYPDGSEARVVLGVPTDLTDPDVYTPTPWTTYTYDPNDNAGRTHPTTSTGYAKHWNTPSSSDVDALGRVVRTVARNGTATSDWQVTSSSYDILGHLVAVTDAAGREAFRYEFDLAGRRWRMDSIDAGRRDAVPDVVGRPIETRDSKGALTLQAYDVLHRITRRWARDDATAPVGLRQRIEYGDAGDPDQPAADRARAAAANLLGTESRRHDEAGLMTVTAVDFKGNVLESIRRVIADAPLLASYQNAAARNWVITPFQADWSPTPGQTLDQLEALLLEPTGYQNNAAYDALNRITSRLFPSGPDGRRSELRPTYHRAGTLARVSLDGTEYVRHLAYNAKGQRVLIAYGNGVMTRYAYDPVMFRLVRLRSEPYIAVDATTFQPSGAVLQDYGYDYDLVGNILALHDRTPGSGIAGNPQALGATDARMRLLLGGGDALDRQFGYDPLYRLIRATGREQQGTAAGDPWVDVPRGDDPTRTQAYTESYTYDAAGNLISLNHTSVDGFTRTATLASGSNRLKRVTIGSRNYDYTSDPNGNLTGETSSRHFSWNHADQPRTFSVQTPGAEPSIHAQYLYDSSGVRTKKLVRRQGGTFEVTHYVGVDFEHHRWTGVPSPKGAPGGQNFHVHVLDDADRIALVRTGDVHPDDHGPAVSVHLADHLGSSTMVLDGTGSFVNREEYTPYGETSFGSYARKRYRFTGRERDEESGLAHHGQRYYAPALARWTSADPQAPSSGLNAFQYCRSSPLMRTDPGGGEDEEVADLAKALQDVASNLEATIRRLPNESPSAYGTRLHDMFQRIMESGQFNFPKVENSRVITELIVDRHGTLVAFSTKPGGAPSESVTADIGILKKGISNTDRLVGRKIADILELAIDFKTGVARIATRQVVAFASWGLSVFKLSMKTDLPAKIASARPGRAPQRGSASLGTMVGVASLGVLFADLYDDHSPENLARVAKGMAGMAAVDAVAVYVLGRSLGWATLLLGMRSDDVRASQEQERQEALEEAERQYRHRVWDYLDRHPGEWAAARQHATDAIMAEELARQLKKQDER
jgi:RHS repeat-associated protein